MMSRHLVVLAVVSLGVATPAQAGPVLTAQGAALGFTLDTFASGGPLYPYASPFIAVASVGGGYLAVVDRNNAVELFTDTNNHAYGSQLSSVNLSGVVNIANAGGNAYTSVLGGGLFQVTRIGTTLGLSGVGVSGFTFGYGLAGNPVNGHLYAPLGGGSTGSAGIYDINPTTGTASAIFTGKFVDGVSVSPDGKTVYGAVATSGTTVDSILGFDIATHVQVFSFTSTHSPDGAGAIAGGLLDGYVVSNNNDGTVTIINPATGTETVIVTGLIRGDFTSPDLNNGSLLLADRGASYRLGAPPGGSFATAAVPEPASLAVFGLAIGGAVCGWRRRRFHIRGHGQPSTSCQAKTL